MKIFFMTIIGCSVLMGSGPAWAVPVDLTGFLVWEGIPGSVTEFGGVITFKENDTDAVLYFYNDNFWVPSNATYLSFGYDLSLMPEDNDYLQFNINFIEQFSTVAAGTGWFTFDLTPYQGQTIAMDWGLNCNGDSSPTAVTRVYDIDLGSSGGGGAPVPEPTTLLLLGSGLIGLAGARRAKAAKIGK